MSTSTIARGAKVVGAVTAGIVIAASVGPAATSASATSAAPAVVVTEPAPVAAADPVVAAASAAIAQPTSWRATAGTTGAVSAATRPSRQAAARAALVAKQARFAAFTLTSKETRDMRGVEPSLYRGRFYNKASESKRLCVVERESEGFYDVVNPSGAYRGAYQVSAALARGATWMMLKEHRQLMGPKAAKTVLAKLRAKPMNTWPRYWQDAAFHTIINWDHTLSGAGHWAGGRWHC